MSVHNERKGIAHRTSFHAPVILERPEYAGMDRWVQMLQQPRVHLMVECIPYLFNK